MLTAIVFVIAFYNYGDALHMLAQYVEEGNGSAHQFQRKDNKDWKVVSVGELEAHDGTSLSFRTYKMSNAVTVTTIDGEFPSPALSLAELTFQRTQAKVVIEEGVKNDICGNAVGQRIVASMSGTETEPPFTAIIWTDDSFLHEIMTSSLETALKFEKHSIRKFEKCSAR
jgi:hypothetical protein